MDKIEKKIDECQKKIINQGMKVKHIMDCMKNSRVPKVEDFKKLSDAHIQGLNDLFSLYEELESLQEEYSHIRQTLFI